MKTEEVDEDLVDLMSDDARVGNFVDAFGIDYGCWELMLDEDGIGYYVRSGDADELDDVRDQVYGGT